MLNEIKDPSLWFLRKSEFQLAMESFITRNWKHLANAPSLGHIPCLANMEEYHGLPSFSPAKWLSFYILLVTNYHENNFDQCSQYGHACQKKKVLILQMKTWFHARRAYLHTILIGQCLKFKHAWYKINGLSLTCTQTILSHCFDFVPQGCLGD